MITRYRMIHLWLRVAHILEVVLVVVVLVLLKREVVHVPTRRVNVLGSVYSVVLSLLVVIIIVRVVMMRCLHII